MEETILDLPRIVINGGRRGFLVDVDPRDVMRILKPVLVKVAV
jgi:prolyl-tRNA editing enzyme YbaK/EbsC (Cys-tRNA(Pro) deacylase)